MSDPRAVGSSPLGRTCAQLIEAPLGSPIWTSGQRGEMSDYGVWTAMSSLSGMPTTRPLGKLGPELRCYSGCTPNLGLSLLAKSGGGVKTCRPPCGQPGRHGGDDEEQCRHGAIGCGVGRLHANQHRGHPAGEDESCNQTGGDADGREAKSLAHDELENIAGLSTQGHANADFGGTLSHDCRKHAVESDAREQRGDYRERSDEE